MLFKSRSLSQIAVLLLPFLVFMSLMVPAQQAAAAGCLLSDYATYVGKNPDCATVNVGTEKVTYPRLKWTLRSEIAIKPAPGEKGLSFEAGDRKIVLNNRAAQALNLLGADVSSLLAKYSKNAPIVFARYSPSTADLRIDAFKIEKLANGKVGVYSATFGPHQGDMWKVSQAYLSPSERLSGAVGLNPFEQFKGADDVFHGIAMDGVQVAMGHAMRYFNAAVGFLASADMRFDQRKETSGGWLKKKTKYIVEGFAKPHWYVATPASFQPFGTTTAICAVKGEANCQTEHIAPSLIALSEFQGGNMPMTEDMLYHWEQTKSGFTFLSFIIMAFVVAYATALLFNGTMLSTLVNAATGLPVGGSPLAIASFEAGVYAGGSLIVSGGGALTGVQQGYYGKIGSDGSFAPPEASNEHQAGLNSAVKTRQTEADITAGMTGVVQLEQSTAPHPGDYTEFNSIRYSLENGAPVQQGLDNDILLKPR